MCGIFVVWSSQPVEADRFHPALATLARRGPDAQRSKFLENDCLALGHTRLSIIDLSSRANQPMSAGSHWVVFNGEIYNFPQLKAELIAEGCAFTTTSDTEVLLHGYRVWGDRLTEKLMGMFAFAIWDEQTQEMFLARDHFGQKPLFYAELEGQFIVASEIKAIRSYVGAALKLRKESIVDAMVQDFVADPDTWFSDIHSLQAGHELRVRRRGSGPVQLSRREYWTYRPEVNPRPIGDEACYERLDTEVQAAVRSHLLADVEVGAFLSGGADSTCIATLANSMTDGPIKTYSIGFGANDELPLARDTAARIGSVHHEGIVLEEHYRASVEQALQIFDHPFADTSLVPTEQVSMLAAEDVKVVLTGDGGDECFGGYDYGRFLAPGLSQRKPPSRPLAAFRHQLTLLANHGLHCTLGHRIWAQQARARLVDARRLSRKRRGVLAPALLDVAANYDPSEHYRRHSIPELSPFRDAQWIGIKVPLASKMLVKVDRCSMYHSLETRAPFLSPALMEWALNLPLSVTNPRPNWYKGMFRSWLQGRVSDGVLNAPKRGFSVPKHWDSVILPSRSEELFPRCVEAELLKRHGWHALRDNPRLLWHLSQVEKALATGVFDL